MGSVQDEVLIGYLMSEGQTRAAAEEKIQKDRAGVEAQMKKAQQEHPPATDPTQKVGKEDAISSDREQSPFEPGQQPEPHNPDKPPSRKR